MSKVQFIFALHNHQPVGNFDFVAEEAYQKSYLPFLALLKRHRTIKVTLHYTGILYRFFEERHPEFLDMLRDLVKQGRVEILSGGFYEPILAILPDDDKIGQITALSAFVKKRLGCTPRGMWLAERVWEPHLPRYVAAAGIDHVVVDDFHFKMAGLRDEELDGYYLTEEQGSLVRIFPGSEQLRYLIPFHQPEETIAFLKTLRSPDRNRLAVMADDGEKFGVWPETYRTVYEEGWLEKFFSLLEANAEWLETTTFAGFIAKEPARGSIYLPTASYMEMGEWALPTPAMGEYCDVLAMLKGMPECGKVRPFIKGGIWRNFLAKYPESNHMHKRMLMVSAKVRAALAGATPVPARDRAKMLDHLYQSQCNDAYWHGVFGGLYLPHLRSAVYEQLIRAEYLADALLLPGSARRKPAAGKKAAQRTAAPSWAVAELGDFDRDGDDEVMLNTELMNLFLDPAEGGRITELDWKPRSFNLMNTLTRRREGYHAKVAKAGAGGDAGGGAKTIHERVVVKEAGLERHLSYDRYTRASLIDHFLTAGADLQEFMQSESAEAGDFVDGRYHAIAEKRKQGVAFSLERTGSAAGLTTRIRKTLALQAGSPESLISYEITNLDSRVLNASFGSEFNFSLLAGNAHDRYYDIPGRRLEQRNLASTGVTDGVEQVSLVDEWLKLSLSLRFSKPAALWRAPVETVSQSEAGFERVYQSSMVMPVWRLALAAGEVWKVEFRLRID